MAFTPRRVQFHRSSTHKTCRKYPNIYPNERRACIPRLIWNDGHIEWSRRYFFKDIFRISDGRYCGFKYLRQ